MDWNERWNREESLPRAQHLMTMVLRVLAFGVMVGGFIALIAFEMKLPGWVYFGVSFVSGGLVWLASIVADALIFSMRLHAEAWMESHPDTTRPPAPRPSQPQSMPPAS